jgi:hypothetical protein
MCVACYDLACCGSFAIRTIARFDPVSEIVSRSVAQAHATLVRVVSRVYLVGASIAHGAACGAAATLANQMPLQTQSTASRRSVSCSRRPILVMFNLLATANGAALSLCAVGVACALQAALRTFARALGLETYFFGFAQGEAVPNDPERVMYLNGEDFGSRRLHAAPILRASGAVLARELVCAARARRRCADVGSLLSR